MPWPLPDLKWSMTLFDIGGKINFGAIALPAKMTEIGTGNVSTLNIGARRRIAVRHGRGQR